MNSFKIAQCWLKCLSSALLCAVFLALPSQAQESSNQNQSEGTPEYFQPAGFVDEALAYVLAEISLAKNALEKSRLYSTQSYAQKVIDDYTNLSNQLRELAEDKKLKVSSEEELADRAIALTQRDDNATGDEQERFDLNYARQELASHERSMSMFHQATQSTDYDIKNFAQSALVILEKHRKRAEQLIAENDDGTPPAL